jgi:hypothetical protein
VTQDAEKNDSEVDVALTTGSSLELKVPTGKVAAKKTAKKGMAATNNTAEELKKMIDEMNTPEEKQKILIENGIKATGGKISKPFQIGP